MVYPIEPSRLLTCNVIALCPDAIVKIDVICLHVLILYFSFFVCYVFDFDNQLRYIFRLVDELS